MGACQTSHSKQLQCVCCSIKSGFLVQNLCKYVQWRRCSSSSFSLAALPTIRKHKRGVEWRVHFYSIVYFLLVPNRLQLRNTFFYLDLLSMDHRWWGYINLNSHKSFFRIEDIFNVAAPYIYITISVFFLCVVAF